MTARVKPGSGKKVEEMARSSCSSDEVRAVHAVGQHVRSDQPHGTRCLVQRLTYLGTFHPATAMVLD